MGMGRLGAHGRATSTGHVPEHAKAAMEKKKAAWYCTHARTPPPAPLHGTFRADWGRGIPPRMHDWSTEEEAAWWHALREGDGMEAWHARLYGLAPHTHTRTHPPRLLGCC